MATLTRERLRELLAQQFELADLHVSAAKHIADLREGKHGPAMQAALRAMERAIEESSK